MPLTESLKELITSQCDFNALRKAAMKEGMRSLRLSGAQKIAAGLTTLEEILRVAPSTET